MLPTPAIRARGHHSFRVWLKAVDRYTLWAFNAPATLGTAPRR